MQEIENSSLIFPKAEGIGNNIGLGIEALLNFNNPFALERYQWSKIVDKATNNPSDSYIPNNEPNFLMLVLLFLVGFIGIKIITK